MAGKKGSLNIAHKLAEYDRTLLINNNIKAIGGVDEAGRGPLCGPLVVAGCVMPISSIINGVNDSKKLSEQKREELYNEIVEKAIAYKAVVIDSDRIDEINILEATKQGMLECVQALESHMDLCVIDAVKLDTKVNTLSIVKADETSYSVACASIIAKVTRDRIMREYSLIYPEYLLELNKGYGTKSHIEAIKKCGITSIHRKTFTKNFIV